MLHLRTKHGVSEKKFAKNDQTCEICKIVPTTKLYFKLHCYWRHSKDDSIEGEVKRKKAQNLQKNRAFKLQRLQLLREIFVFRSTYSQETWSEK